MKLNKTFKNIKRWNETKIKPLTYINFYINENSLYQQEYYKILWSNDDVILINQGFYSYLMSLKQWKGTKTGNYRFCKFDKIKYIMFNNKHNLENIKVGDYEIDDTLLEKIREEIHKPYYL